MTLENLRTFLSKFVEANPASTIEELPNLGCCVVRPWGDASLAIRLPQDSEELLDALNNVYLPDQYSLLYHLDSSKVEVIYTSYKISDSVQDIENRSFDFVYEGSTYHCYFGPSSNRLLEIARQHETLSQSNTQSRNLITYKQFVNAESAPDFLRSIFGTPLSFWINDFQWKSADFVQGFVKNLNFMMAYFDTSTPRIIIHSLHGGSAIQPDNTRFPFGYFPREIVAHPIDDNLYQFWDATLSGDPIRKFLYNYQIIEYASVYYLDEDNKRAIRRLLKTPDASSRLDTIVQSIIETLGSSKMHDIHKVEALIKKCVDYELIWSELQKQIDVFSSDIKFEGGFVSKALLKRSTKQEDFETNWVSVFCGRIRDMRNALSHGKETKSGAVIFPTIANQDRIQSWLPILSTTSKQIIVYADTV